MFKDKDTWPVSWFLVWRIYGKHYIFTSSLAVFLYTSTNERFPNGVSAISLCKANWGGEGAWIYRKAFDHMLAAYEGKTPPGDGRRRDRFGNRGFDRIELNETD